MELSELSIPNLAMPKQGGGCTISRGNKCEKKKAGEKMTIFRQGSGFRKYMEN